MRKTRLTLAAAVATAALAGGASAQAATTSSLVTSAVGPELSLAIAAPAAMLMTHAAPGTTTANVTVTSTGAWTLAIKDAQSTPVTPGVTDTTAGRMDKCAAGILTAGTSLTNALQWKTGANAFTALTGVDATVLTGSLVSSVPVDFQQSLGATEAVNAGDQYCLTVAYTVS
jgi:hypothetical protein